MVQPRVSSSARGNAAMIIDRTSSGSACSRPRYSQASREAKGGKWQGNEVEVEGGDARAVSCVVAVTG
eukprot:scaffold91472_cov31-Tisochrysis_lutea.AAC.5